MESGNWERYPGYRFRITVFIIMFLSLSTGYRSLWAETLPFELPKELMTTHGPIPPVCFLRFTGEGDKKEPLDLKLSACLKYKQKYNKSALARGFLGYNLDSSEPKMRQVSIFYRYIGTVKKNNKTGYIFELNYSGGGSGFFSSLIELSLKNNILSISKYIAGGDRCFGGIESAAIKDNVLHYKVRQTPHMMVEAGDKIAHVEAFSTLTLDDCAVCCIGFLLMEDEKITGFQFNGMIPEAEPGNRQQLCFNSLIKSNGAENKATLDKKQFNKLQKEIISTCIRL